MKQDSGYSLIEDLTAACEVPADGILTRTQFEDKHVKIVRFGFSAGQELSEHTSSMPATLHFITGEASLRLGNDTRKVRPGSWVYMPPDLPHGIKATTPLTMLLVLMKPSPPPAR